MYFTQVPWVATLLATEDGRIQLAHKLFKASQQDDSDRRDRIINLVERMYVQSRDGSLSPEANDQIRSMLVSLSTLTYTGHPEFQMLRAVLDMHLHRKIQPHSTRTWQLREYLNTYNSADDQDECTEYISDARDLFVCDDCHEYEFSDHSTHTYHDESICRACIENSYVYSEYYDRYVHNELGHWARDEDGAEVYVHENDDQFRWDEDLQQYVHVNYEYEPPEPEVIQSYHSSKGQHRPIKDDWSTNLHRWLGVELEVEARDINQVDRAKQLNEKINEGKIGNKVFFERDGSLTNGFEIITQPMSLPAHRELWQWVNDRGLVAGLRSHNTSTCGLHVHVNRDALSGLQIARIVTFVNDPNNEQLIKAIARRYGEGYCKIKVKTLDTVLDESNDRYEAVNITPRKTIEFRIFKGTLKYESLMAAVEFANAMVDFSNKMKTAADLTTQNFMTFINEDAQAETPYLRPYIEQRLELA